MCCCYSGGQNEIDRKVAIIWGNSNRSMFNFVTFMLVLFFQCCSLRFRCYFHFVLCCTPVLGLSSLSLHTSLLDCTRINTLLFLTLFKKCINQCAHMFWYQTNFCRRKCCHPFCLSFSSIVLSLSPLVDLTLRLMHYRCELPPPAAS